MAALKAGEVGRFVETPDPRYPVILVYGPDAGGVAERCARLADKLGGGSDDPFAAVRLDGDDLAADPLRLADEANTVGLFGGKRLIRVRAGAKPFQKAVEPLMAAPPQDAVVIIEAGDLNRTSPLRSLVERSKHAVALPCYPDEGRDLLRLIDEEVRAAGSRIDADARDLLAASIGGDRLGSRAEIAKLLTYALGEPVITAAHVAAICSDVVDTALDDLVDAAFDGDRPTVSVALGRLVADGNRPDVLLGAALRHALVLARLSSDVAGGKSADEAAKDAFKHFRRERRVAGQLASATSEGALAAAQSVATAIATARKQPRLAGPLAERCLMSLRQIVAGDRRRARG